MKIRRWLAVAAMLLLPLGVACETEDDPGGEGDLGYTGDTTVTTTVDGASDGGNY